MNSRRTAKVAEAIRETVSSTILFGLKDPRVKNVTVLSAEVSSDFRNAKVYISIMGTDKEQSLCMHGLNSARGYLQSKLADRLQTRYTPVLQFVLDEGVKKSIEASRLIREALADGVELPPEEEQTGQLTDELPEDGHESAEDDQDSK